MAAFAFYTAGPELLLFRFDSARGALTLAQTLSLPGNGQYAVLHPSGNGLYLAVGKPPQPTSVLAFTIEAGSGALRPLGPPAPLPDRAIHVEIDRTGSALFVSLLDPGTVLVLRLAADGTLGAAVEQPAPVEAGVFLHQARVTPDGKALLVCARGNDPAGGKPEDAGALSCFAIADGTLVRTALHAMPPGVGPRHLDFGPGDGRAYVAIERGNALGVFTCGESGLDPRPVAVVGTLARPGAAAAGQRAGAVHVHPSGRFVYLSNRGQLDPGPDGAHVFGGGENAIAAFALDGPDRVPRLVQHSPVHGLEPRSFAIDPTARWLVAANQYVTGEAPASLDVFAIGVEGRLTHARSLQVGGPGIVWVGFSPRALDGDRA